MIQNITFWIFLVAMVPSYWLLPVKYRHIFLAIASSAYLCTIDYISVMMLFSLSVFVYVTAPLKFGRFERPIVIGIILVVFSLLGWFKYIPEFLSIAQSDKSVLETVIIPLGISYYTFKLVHYFIEYRRGQIPEHDFSTFASYMLLFPIFTAGPIERFEHFLESRTASFTTEDFTVGTTRIIHGLIKKVIVVDYLIREVADPWVGSDFVLNNLASTSSLSIWVVLASNYVILYLEFSAYSDIAIGSSRLFGIKIMENFNWPVIATNISDFWRRWHMTLARWCQTYVYMPVMGITRTPYAAAFASFAVIGLWHAGTVTRLSWGLYHACGIVAYMIWTRFRRKKLKLKTVGTAGKCFGFVITQLFIISSMAFLVIEDANDVLLVGQLILKLFYIDTF